MCGFLRFSSASAAKQPCCPSVGFCRSAHSSRSYSVATVSQILDSCCSADGATHPEGPVFRDTVEWRSAVYELDQHYARVRDSPNEGIEYMGNGRSIQCPRCFIFVRPPRGIVDGIHAGGRPGRPMSEPKRHFCPTVAATVMSQVEAGTRASDQRLYILYRNPAVQHAASHG